MITQPLLICFCVFSCCIAVRSFGTEDRETAYPILPQPTVYDYILFRGSDIKDIRVVNNVAIPNDPAIMQMQLPPQQNFAPQNFPHGAPPMNFAAFNQMQGNMGSSQMGPGMQQQQQNQSPIPSQQKGNNNINLAPGSGSGQKNKKSSELSNGKDITNEKSSTKSTAIRKQSNKSQGVHRSYLSLSLSLLFAWLFFISTACLLRIGFKRSPQSVQHVETSQHQPPSKLFCHQNHLVDFSCT